MQTGEGVREKVTRLQGEGIKSLSDVWGCEGPCPPAVGRAWCEGSPRREGRPGVRGVPV